MQKLDLILCGIVAVFLIIALVKGSPAGFIPGIIGAAIVFGLNLFFLTVGKNWILPGPILHSGDWESGAVIPIGAWLHVIDGYGLHYVNFLANVLIVAVGICFGALAGGLTGFLGYFAAIFLTASPHNLLLSSVLGAVLGLFCGFLCYRDDESFNPHYLLNGFIGTVIGSYATYFYLVDALDDIKMFLGPVADMGVILKFVLGLVTAGISDIFFILNEITYSPYALFIFAVIPAGVVSVILIAILLPIRAASGYHSGQEEIGGRFRDFVFEHIGPGFKLILSTILLILFYFIGGRALFELVQFLQGNIPDINWVITILRIAGGIVLLVLICVVWRWRKR